MIWVAAPEGIHYIWQVNGWKVFAVDKEQEAIETIKEINSSILLKNITLLKNEFETIKLPKSDLIIAFFSLFFCKPQAFKNLWKKINNSLINEGYFVGNFLGKRDSWANRQELTILSKNEVLKLFTGYNIIYFMEKEYDGLTGLGNQKH